VIDVVSDRVHIRPFATRAITYGSIVRAACTPRARTPGWRSKIDEKFRGFS
jgi:hypothetical protein